MKARDLTGIALFIALMTAGAYLRIPFPVISLTFQAFFAVLSGPVLGPRKAPLAMVLYLLLGLAGLPVFAAGGGFGYILTPSFGFLLGFIPGSWLSGLIHEKTSERGRWFLPLSLWIGMLTIYAIGVPYMTLILRFYLRDLNHTLLTVGASLLLYLLKDTLLCFPAALIASRLRPFLANRKECS